MLLKDIKIPKKGAYPRVSRVDEHFFLHFMYFWDSLLSGDIFKQNFVQPYSERKQLTIDLSKLVPKTSEKRGDEFLYKKVFEPELQSSFEKPVVLL